MWGDVTLIGLELVIRDSLQEGVKTHKLVSFFYDRMPSPWVTGVQFCQEQLIESAWCNRGSSSLGREARNVLKHGAVPFVLLVLCNAIKRQQYAGLLSSAPTQRWQEATRRKAVYVLREPKIEPTPEDIHIPMMTALHTVRFHWGPVMKRAKQLTVRKRNGRNTTDLGGRPRITSGGSQASNATLHSVVNDQRNRTSSNISALHADNDFLKKTGVMRDMQVQPGHSQSFTVVVVIASLFLFVTMAITMALVVFCRKRNSVFAFQKSEQEDYPDYEMEEMETDVEYTETDSDTETSSLRKQQRRSKRVCKCQQSPSSVDRGDYQMVVTALVDRGSQEPGECSSRTLHAVKSKQERRFYGMTNMPPDVFQTQPLSHPKVNITYTNEVNAGQNSNNMYSVVVTMESPKTKLRNSRSDCNIQYHMASSNTAAKTVHSHTTCPSKGPFYVSLPQQESLKTAANQEKTLPNHTEPSSSGELDRPGPPATHFVATGAERIGRIGSIRSLSREQCMSLISLRSNCPTQVNDQTPTSLDEQESLLEEYFLNNYPEDQLFSD
ncbi:hypothetical protein CAPTEDRAFT_195379 [Capitella teleta]|uniref:Uncharacterized protein n=1 Tax=Capitella teleta TaxID=283909 RepID=R7TAY3_CAPTE|nr:hypothetical protein CAPTEDRAFT_195379 [Capitella teleta]|eukprot:ELT88149.1 hypothetical protein CAPTEDRAFT_195379 [Capitella teleta]